MATRLDCVFIEGDDYHPSSNVATMRAGLPLTDADRAPWLKLLYDAIAHQVALGERAIVACSALKPEYRAMLRGGTPSGSVAFILLEPTSTELAKRVAVRRAHFMPPELLQSQLDTLQYRPEDVFMHFMTDATPEEIASAVIARLKEESVMNVEPTYPSARIVI